MDTLLKPLLFSISLLDDTVRRGITELQKSYPIRISEDGIRIAFHKVYGTAISASFKSGVYEIEADSAPHFYFALSMLLLKSQTMRDSEVYAKGHARAHALEFRMEHFFEKNGLMLDLSRNAVARIETLKEYIRALAFMGHSWFMLYMEDVYEVEGEPYFGALRGRYSIKDLQEIDRYAALFGIEVVPCIQTLAHVNQYFMWEHEERLYQDIDDIFNVGNERVRALLRRMIASLRKAFSTDTIHIGMDEAYNLGRGRYLDEQGLKSKGQIMQEHLAFMQELCKNYGFTPIVWDDMFFNRYSAAASDTLSAIPEGVGLMYWNYYDDTVEQYSKTLQRFHASARWTLFAGGAWRWTGYAPHHRKTLVTTLAALEACRNVQIKDIIVTAWGDDGSEAPLYTCMFGVTLYAYLDYHRHYDETEFDRYLALYTGIGFDKWMRQGEIDLFKGTTGKNYDITPSKYLLYQDPLNSKFLYYIRTLTTDMDEVYKTLEKEFIEDAQNTIHPLQKQIAEFYASLTKTLYYKWRLPLDIWEAYKKSDKKTLRALTETKIEPLKKALSETAHLRRKLWMTECRGFGCEIPDHRFGALLMRLDATQEVLAAYIRGSITRIDELEEDRLDPCPNADKLLEPQAIPYNRALHIMSACKHTW